MYHRYAKVICAKRGHDKKVVSSNVFFDFFTVLFKLLK